MNRSAVRGVSIVPFLVLVACAAGFVWLTSRSLPTLVASHFGGSGQANGFMPRETYQWMMLVIVALAPLVLTVLSIQVIRKPNARINLPHPDYWLAPERREQTIEVVLRRVVRFSTRLLLFLCYVHWLVVQANQTQPPSLSTPWFVGGLVIFLLSTIMGVVSLLGRFRDTPN